MFVEVVNNMRKKLDRWGTKDYNVQVCEYRNANQSPGEHLNYRFIYEICGCVRWIRTEAVREGEDSVRTYEILESAS